MRLIHSTGNTCPRKVKVGIRFSFDTLFIFDSDVCVGIEKNLVLNQKVIFKLLEYVCHMIMVRMVQREVQQYGEFDG